MQIGEVEQVRKNEIAIKAHERACVECQRQHPTGGCQVQQGIAQWARIGQRPAQRGKPGQGQLGEDARGGNGQTLPGTAQLPAFARVGVEHWPHDHKGDAHMTHAQAQAGGDQRVPQLMQGLGQRQSNGKTDQA
ncbi:hypothetical protein D3C77_508370 [compost metagenome]